MSIVTNHTPGSFCWFELATTDQNGAKKFYESLFGWTATDTPLNERETYTEFQVQGRDVAATYFAVADCAASVKKAGELGAKTIFGQTTLEGTGTFAAIADPQGAVFAIIQPKP